MLSIFITHKTKSWVRCKFPLGGEADSFLSASLYCYPSLLLVEIWLWLVCVLSFLWPFSVVWLWYCPSHCWRWYFYGSLAWCRNLSVHWLKCWQSKLRSVSFWLHCWLLSWLLGRVFLLAYWSEPKWGDGFTKKWIAGWLSWHRVIKLSAKSFLSFLAAAVKPIY